VRLRGSAIECRIYAEDPAEGFVPATGPVGRLRVPDGDGVHVHHGLREGDAVTAAFDPMLAKVAAWGPTREAAIARLRGALGATVVLGTITNTGYLERVVAHPAFAAGETYTTFLEEHAADLALPPAPPELERLLLAAAALASPRFDGRFALSPLHAAIGAWGRGPAHPEAGDPLELTLGDGAARRVAVTRTPAGGALVRIDGREVRAALEAYGDRLVVRADALHEPVDVYVEHDAVHVHARGRAWRVAVIDPVVRAQTAVEGVDVVSAPMPGTVLRVPVAAGEAVVSGQPLVVIESMKMQSELVAQRDGVVARVHLAAGDTFDRGAALVTLDEEAS
jgi:acetyl/propionyl-CoA carboxylase alpha subunit